MTIFEVIGEEVAEVLEHNYDLYGSSVTEIEEETKLIGDLNLPKNKIEELILSIEFRLDVHLHLYEHANMFDKEDSTVGTILDAVLKSMGIEDV